MILRLLFIRISLIFLFSSKFLFSIPADVEDISNRKYFPAVLKAIQEAQTSIKASLYYISYFKSKKGKVHDLLNALFDASKRGVDVEVLLDQGREFTSSDMSKKNVRAFSHLKQNGIKVYYDAIEILSHSKYLIIDEKIVIVGSFNWSENAFTRNLEAAVLIKSSEVAKDYSKLFNAIPKFSPERIKDAIPIPREFIQNKDLAANMTSRKNDTAFDFYLWMQKRSLKEQSKFITLTEQELIDYYYHDHPVKLSGSTKDYLQKFMKDMLKMYRKKYPYLVGYKRDGEKMTLTVELDKINTGDNDSLYISKKFWDNGWNERLKLPARFCLLYLLDKTDSGRMGSYVSQARTEAVKEYGVSIRIFTYGTKELSRYNLIEKKINFKVGESNPNGYILNDFYDFSDFQKKLKNLEKNTNKNLFQAVVKIADLVNEPCDLNVHRRLIILGEKYGLQVLKDSITVIEKHESGISPYRQYDYVLGMIEAEGQGKWDKNLLEFEKFKEQEKLKIRSDVQT